jgi:hypothetical protein
MPLTFTLPKAIAQALISHAAKGDTRFAMNGVLIEVDAGRVIFIASDTHRLICYSPAFIDDKVTPLAEYAAKVKAEQVTKREADIRACNAAGENPKSDAALAPEIEAAKNAIMDNPLRIILSIPAFKSRLQKISRSTNFYFSIENFRADEMIDGQFPRYREVFPPLSDRIGIQFSTKSGDEYASVLSISEGVNLRYLQDAAPVLAHIGTFSMRQHEPGAPYNAQSGIRPWNSASCAKTEAEKEFVAVLVMPVRGN